MQLTQTVTAVALAIACSLGCSSAPEGDDFQQDDEGALATSAHAKLKGTYAGRGQLARLVLSPPDADGEGTFQATVQVTTTLTNRNSHRVCKTSPCPGRTTRTTTTKHDGSYKVTARSIRFEDPNESSDLIDTFRYSFDEEGDEERLVLSSDAARFSLRRSP